jgi:3-isopropylmalate/(R)-2-methylmalate dehydratase small subunit
MEKFTRIAAPALPLAAPNVDTDQIIPARFLWHAQADLYGQWLFNDLRFAKEGGAPTDFVLNEARYRGAQILVGDNNFGCGSSREQAVWALYDYGFRVVIAPSFGDIFYNNCFKQGVLAITLPAAETARLRESVQHGPSASMTVDLESQTIHGPQGLQTSFEIAAFRKKQLLLGLDDIELTLAHGDAITAFETAYDQATPWLAVRPI